MTVTFVWYSFRHKNETNERGEDHFKLGELFGESSRDFRLINNDNNVILAENNEKYLCAKCTYDKSNELVIYTSQQTIISNSSGNLLL